MSATDTTQEKQTMKACHDFVEVLSAIEQFSDGERIDRVFCKCQSGNIVYTISVVKDRLNDDD